jgi:acetylornithine/succinyldiaminopimelate/putrescine aminotransferase
VVFVPYGDIKALDAALDDSVAGVILEPVQGEGGVTMPPSGYLKKAQALAHERGALFILDEVQTGMGRTGKDFAFRYFDAPPDILTLGKGLGSGFPVAATLSMEEAGKALSPGTHSSTLGGAPLAMAVALTLSQKILDDTFLAEVENRGAYFLQGLKNLQGEFPSLVSEARGLGLMLGLELKVPSPPISEALLKEGFLVNATALTVLRFVPPLTVGTSEIDLLIAALKGILSRQKA